MSDYVLGISDHELDRLTLQQEVWSAPTRDFLDALELEPGARVLDLGCGPGLLLGDLCERVGPDGLVIGVDESPRWIEHVRREIEAHGWTNARAECARIQELDLEPSSADLILMRWVLGFLPDRAEVLRSLAPLLRPGGRIAVLDYNHEGVSLFPDSESFRAAIRATRELYATRGGDTWVMGRITGLFRAAGLEPVLLKPYVIAGWPGSPAFRWADAFFPFHTEGMVEVGVLTAAEREAFLAEWEERKRDPDTLFFSPIVVGAAARKTAS